MWRSPLVRLASARDRLALAAALWGWRPHPAQERFFLSPAQVRVAACGRRWGKTEALSLDIATLALEEARQGRDCRQLVVAPTDAQARLIGNETVSLLLEAFLGASAEVAGLDLTMRQRPGLQLTICPVGVDPRVSNDKKAKGGGPAVSRVLFRSGAQDGRGLRGLWAHRIVGDEAGYIPDRVLTEVLLPMLTDVGGELVLASSPAGRRNVFYRLFARGCSRTGLEAQETPTLPSPETGEGGEEAPPPPIMGEQESLSYAAFQCPSSDNPHLDRAYLAAMAEELGEQSFAAEYLAQFVDDFGAVFRADDIEGCLAADDRVTLVEGNLVSAPDPERWYSVGVDWGRKRDFTVVCVLDGTDRAEGRPARLVGLWRWQGVGWEAQAAKVAEIVAAFRPRRVLADGNSIGDPVAERLQGEIGRRVAEGERCPVVEQFVFGAESKGRLVDSLTLGLSGRSLTYPAHKALLSELRGFEYGAETSGGRHRMAARGGGHDDIVMALALAWYCAPEGAPPSPSSLLLLGSSAGLPKRE